KERGKNDVTHPGGKVQREPLEVWAPVEEPQRLRIDEEGTIDESAKPRGSRQMVDGGKGLFEEERHRRLRGGERRPPVPLDGSPRQTANRNRPRETTWGRHSCLPWLRGQTGMSAPPPTTRSPNLRLQQEECSGAEPGARCGRFPSWPAFVPFDWSDNRPPQGTAK